MCTPLMGLKSIRTASENGGGGVRSFLSPCGPQEIRNIRAIIIVLYIDILL